MSAPAQAPAHFRNRQDRLRDHSEGYVEMKADVTLFYDGLKTEARVTLTGDKGEETFYGEGIARCRPTDHYDREMGEQIAFLRGLKEATEDALLHTIDQTVTEAEYKAEQDALQNTQSQRSSDSSRLAELLAALSAHNRARRATSTAQTGKGCYCGNPDCLYNYRLSPRA